MKVNNIKIKTSLSKPTLKNIKKISSSNNNFLHERKLKHKTMDEIFNDRNISEIMKKLAKI